MGFSLQSGGGEGGGGGTTSDRALKLRTSICVALPTPHCLGESQCVSSQSPLFLTFLTFIDNYPCEGPDNHIFRFV